MGLSRSRAGANSMFWATCAVVDLVDAPGVDVVGDACEPDVLEEAGIRNATAVIFALEDDTTANFATLVARDLNRDARIVVRANDEQDVPKLHRAAADYVQSLATTSGRMIASTVFEDEDVLTYSMSIRVMRVGARDLVGRTIGEAGVRTETGCTVVATARDGKTISDFDPNTLAIEDGDEVVVAGTDEAVIRFEQLFGRGRIGG